MATRLNGWLEETFEEQLLLGNHWLQEQNKKKESRVKNEFDRDWQDLYHDNGSCIDIINCIHPERNSALQVVQTAPLTLTDGQSQVVAHLTPDCAQDLLARFPGLTQLALGTVIAVRKYTIRYTPYGPPRDKLRFIIHRLDWLGDSGEEVREITPLHWAEQIGIVLQQLHHTRELEDRRCLRSGLEAEADEEAMAPTMDESQPAGENTPHTPLPHTQVAFGTQISHPIRPRTSEDEARFLGVKGTGPTLSGNTRREDIQPKTAQLNQLLGLINKGSNNNAAKPNQTSAENTAFSKPQSVTEPSISRTPSRPSTTEKQQPTPSVAENEKAKTTSPELTQGKKRVRENKPPSPITAETAAQAPNMEQEIEQDDTEDTDTLALECSWMKGFVFDQEALKVSRTQLGILQKDVSWHKPQPGVTDFPRGNIPVEILIELSRLADEKAAAEGASDSDSDMAIDSSPEDVDPSPESALQVTQEEEPTTSQVSWSASPSPEPPKRPATSRQGLPPDSSFEVEALSANNNAPSLSTAPDQQSEQPIIIESSNEKEPSAPPSSPPAPAIEFSADSDEEMEMETSVPQGLGEDAAEASPPQGVSKSMPSSDSPRLKPVVQVKETPYSKGKNGQIVALPYSPPKEKQDSSGNSKSTSSTSIVYGTYNEPKSSGSIEHESRRVHIANNAGSRSDNKETSAVLQKEQPQENWVERPTDVTDPDTSMADSPLDAAVPSGQIDQEAQAEIMPTKMMEKEIPVSQSGPTPQSAQIPSNSKNSASIEPPRDEATTPKQLQITPGLTKRKLGDSPSKDSRRHSKRREIKIVGFGDDSPSLINPASALRKDRTESLQRFREERKSSTSFESRLDSATKSGAQRDTEAMDVDKPDVQNSNASLRAMSPRHRSLYEEPSPTEPSSSVILAPQSIPEVSKSATHAQSPIAGGVPVPSAQIAGQTRSTAAAITAEPLTVYQSFKAAYPEYTGDAKHFQGQCTQMHKLDQEDKMVPKWQWDDFIIRNRTDYRDYALDCVDRGENPEPYYRFYKDTIRDTVYKKGVVESRGTLQKALEEFGVQTSVPEQTKQSTKSPRKSKPSRASLPGAFNQNKKPLHDRFHGTHRDRPRHSFPTSSHNTLQTPDRRVSASKTRSPAQPERSREAATVRPTPKSNLLSRLSSDTPPRVSTNRDSIESTGDPFRDYYFAMQRNTSWTGSTKVDRSKPWPHNLAVRPSIDDAPKRKADVLSWNDVL